ncbi:MAG TPA: LysE family translocator [Xanthobacteraceae bacterium]|jgi:threonine/homoserine/homoserine lactone efflux protein|nr:LysE family translocator [Xanthobacteraceae bacterium]
MNLELYLAFVVASTLLVALPGPNVALIISTSLKYGARAGFTTTAGVNCGVVLQLSALATGLSWIVELFAQHFDSIRYIGAAYLALLGLQQLFFRSGERRDNLPRLDGKHAFARGFFVAFANPKTLVFHAAFLPQFLSGGEASRLELWILVATFSAVAAIGDTLYVVFAARAGAAISERAQHVAGKASGIILLGGAAVLLAAVRRP